MMDRMMPQIEVDNANEILIRKPSITTLLAAASVTSMPVNSGSALIIPRNVPNIPATIKIPGRIFNISFVRLMEKIPNTRLNTGFDAKALLVISLKLGWCLEFLCRYLTCLRKSSINRMMPSWIKNTRSPMVIR